MNCSAQCKMDGSSIENWAKLQILLQTACTSLQEFFVKAFKKKFECDWSKDNSHHVIGHADLQKLSTTQRQKIEDTDVGQWDITALRSILTAENLLDLPLRQVEGINQIAEVRNQMNHLAGQSISNGQFNIWWNMIRLYLVEFDRSVEVNLEQIKESCRLHGVAFVRPEEDKVESIAEKAAQLKLDGNIEFKNGKYAKAIEIYSHALQLHGIDPNDRAKIYSNRCIAYIKMFHKDGNNTVLQEAKEDAEKTVELASSWWRGFFRLGQVYTAMQKFDAAERSFSEAFVKDPRNEVMITAAISDVRNKRGEHKRMDYLDPRSVHKSTAELVCDRNKKTGSTTTPSSRKLLEQMWLNSGVPELVSHEYCRLGHRCLAGLDGLPKSNQLAAEYFQKAANMDNAEGMYNLAIMTIHGDGVERNIKLAIEWLRKAAAQPVTDCFGLPRLGVSVSEHKLGMCFEQGVGVPKDVVQAKYWYERSSFNGCPNAANNLGHMYERGLVDEQYNLVKAEQFYQLSARTDLNPDTNAMINLARIYVHYGDLVRGLMYCERAKKNGNIQPFLINLSATIRTKLDKFYASGIPEWEIDTQKSCADLTIRERIERYLCERHHLPDNVLRQRSVLAKKMQPAVPKTVIGLTVDLEDHETCAKSSCYGKFLLEARRHALKAERLFGNEIPSPTSTQKFFEHFAAAHQSHFAVFRFSHIRQRAISLITDLLKKKVPYDEDVRICYVVLEGFNSLETTIPFLDQCIQDYPKSIFFLQWRAILYASLERFEDGIRDTNAALKLDPNNVESLYDRAGMMRLAIPNVSKTDAIRAYNRFLATSPADHPKVPEAYYSIATLKMPEGELIQKWYQTKDDKVRKKLEDHYEEVKRCYELGVTAENEQLPFLRPYESNTKLLSESFLTVSVDLAPLSTSTSPFPVLTSPKILPTPKSPDWEEILSDPNRILRVRQHRAGIKKITEMFSGNPCQWTYKAPKKQETSPSLADLKAITIRDMDPTTDYVYKGHVLSVTIIDEICFTGSSICVIIQDVDGYVERCCIYNWVHMEDVVKTRETFGPGCKITIINPYMRMAHDGKPTVRVDDPTSIISDGFIPDMCRYCCEPNAYTMCSLCDNARYCNYGCQMSDREQLDHHLICQA